MIINNVWNATSASNAGALTGSVITNGGNVQFQFAGSAWSASAGQIIGANLVVDGNNVGTARVLTNEPSSHKALVPISTILRLPAGTHSIAIQAATPLTKIDQNDFFTLVVTEFSFT